MSFFLWYEKCSNFIIWHVAVQIFQHHLLKRLWSNSIADSCFLSCILIDCKCMDFFLGSLSSFIDPCLFFVQYHTVFIIVALYYGLITGSIHPFLFFFLKIVLTIQSLLCFHINFKIICFSSEKNSLGIFMGIALNLWTWYIFPSDCVILNLFH